MLRITKAIKTKMETLKVMYFTGGIIIATAVYLPAKMFLKGFVGEAIGTIVILFTLLFILGVKSGYIEQDLEERFK